MCGKENTIQHNNGLDRLDSDFGYILTNLNSCCGECNYMKKTYEFNLMMDKFILIYSKHKDDIFENNTSSNHSIVKTNKKSKEEIQENAIKKKQLQKEMLKEKYNDEEYKLNRALELARLRKEAR
jgi:benzoyl-CoA reductase/2-hydroxyglutaryl-CoA dehydratase subunit BcrC/BadD/HgdB